MVSKVVVILGLCLAVFLMMASEVTAREMAQTTTTTSFDPTTAEKANGVGGDDKHLDGGYGGAGYGHGGGGCKHGCCGHGHHGCSRCCSYKGEAMGVAKP